MENTIEYHVKDNANRFIKVCTERVRQTYKFGVRIKQNPFEWLAVLGEEVGEVNKAILERDFEHKKRID